MPATEEVVTWGHPTYRVKNKIFASLGASESGHQVGKRPPAEGRATNFRNSYRGASHTRLRW